MFKCRGAFVAGVFLLAGVCSAGDSFTEDDFIVLSSPVSPRVAYALDSKGGQVRLVIQVGRIEENPNGAVTLSAGMSAVKSVILKESDAKLQTKDGITEYSFAVPSSSLVNQEADWEKFRLGLSVAWKGGPFGEDRQRERFLHNGGAAGGGFSSNPNDWSPLNLKEHAAIIANLKNRIFVNLAQPVDGKLSIVIEDEKGRRVRNLIAGQPMKKGKQRIEWDGTDEQGNVVTAGMYSWRAISHAGITPRYLFSFYNNGEPPFRNGSPTSNWLSDHSDPVAAASFGGKVYFGAPVAESGHNVVQLTLDGKKTNHISFPTLVGIGTLFLAADEKCCYAVMEGTPHYEPFKDLPDGKWEFRRPLNIMRWDAATANVVKYKGPRGEKVLTDNTYLGSGPHPRGTKVPNAHNLAGAALLNGRIYVSLNKENRISIVNAENGEQASEIKMEKPGLLATDGKDFMVAFSLGTLMKIDPVSGKTNPLFVPKLSEMPKTGDPEQELYGFKNANPTGMAVNEKREIFLSDNGVDQNIKVFSSDGKLLRTIGKKGGRPLNGTWDGSGMYRPHGITLDKDGKLWVTETYTYPRRISVWDSQSGKLLRDFFGPSHYGADEGSFDVNDHTRWIGGGVLWKLDFETKTAKPISTLFTQTKPGMMQTQMMGMSWSFYKMGNRTFMISCGRGQSVYELRPDGSAKLWSVCGQLTAISQNPRWTLPKAIVDLPAVRALMEQNGKDCNPPVKLDFETFGGWGDKVKFNEKLMRNPKTQAAISILWVDKNGDDLGQPDEFEVLGAGDSFMNVNWGAGNPTLDLNMPATIGGKKLLLKFKPDGFLTSGAPNYSLAKAISNSVPLEPGVGNAECIQDRFGREIFNNSPMRGVAPDGRTLWTYPNRWVGVHGSHESPLPEIGVTQGILWFLGTAPLDEKAEVMMMNGNHGRFFVMTTDGIYLDEMFKDVRVTQIADAYMIGGECFGGYFGKGEDGKYYLQSGHTDYRVFQINGLEQVKRLDGSVSVTPEQVIAAQANGEQKAARKLEKKFVPVEEVTADNKQFTTDPNQWPGLWDTIRWGSPGQPFPFVQVKILRRGDRLHLAYRVKDPSPWVNRGKDWTMLFKTGDCVDFQFSTDPKAKAGRGEPVPGDKKLLVAQSGDKPIAVLYSYRVPGAKAPVSFSSPWRTERVDEVTELKFAQISVKPGDGAYDILISVPLADLGLPAAGQALELLGDFGVIYGDSEGSMDVLRSYWSNQATGLVNDVPGEIMITPRLWGTLKFNGGANQ